MSAPSSTRQRDVRVVTDVECRMRWMWRHQGTNDVVRIRRSRVVLTPRRWRQVGGNALQRACDDASHHTGDDASHRTGDGGKKARSPRRARSRPLKPLRREGRTDPPTPVVTSVCFHFLHTDRGCSGHPAFPAPSMFRRAMSITRARSAPRGCAFVPATSG